MIECTTDLEKKLYMALHRIAYEYEPAEALIADGEEDYGLSAEEVLEMAYDNLQGEAQRAIQGVSLKPLKRKKNGTNQGTE